MKITIGPEQDPIRIPYQRVMTAGDILLELDLDDSFILWDNIEGKELSLEEVISPGAKLLVIPSSIGYKPDTNQVLLNSIKDYKNFGKPATIKKEEKGPRRRSLIENLINCFPENSLQSLDQFSQLIFGNELEIYKFLHDANYKIFPGPLELDIMENNIRKLTLDDVLTVSEQNELNNLKMSLLSVVFTYKLARNYMYQELYTVGIDDGTEYGKYRRGSTGLEDVVRFYFEYLFGVKFFEHKAGTLDWIKLDLDGYNPKLGIAFEANGPHHYEWEWYIGKTRDGVKINTKDLAMKYLEQQQKKDSERREICKDNKIILIEIPYTISNLADYNHFALQTEIINLFNEQGNANKFGLYEKKAIEKWFMVMLMREGFLHADIFYF